MKLNVKASLTITIAILLLAFLVSLSAYCESNTTPNSPSPLVGLSAQDFQHPWDTSALGSLQKVKGLDWLTNKYMELGIEKNAYAANAASRIRLSQEQLPEVWELLNHAAKILDMPVPKLFLEANPYPAAYTLGSSDPYIVISSSLITSLEPAELEFILAHELGHIKARHIIYRAMAQNLTALTGLVGDLTLGIGDIIGKGLSRILSDWYAKSEFTADRAGLLVIQNPEVAIRTLMKLAGGFLPQLSKDALMRQAEDYYSSMGDVTPAPTDKVDVQNSQWLVLRAAELMKWSNEIQYKELISCRS